MFVSKGKYRALQQAAISLGVEAMTTRMQLDRMTENWQEANDEIKRLLIANQEMHETLLRTQRNNPSALTTPGFTRAHLQYIRRQCHPDRNQDSVTATEITQICNRELS